MKWYKKSISELKDGHNKRKLIIFKEISTTKQAINPMRIWIS